MAFLNLDDFAVTPALGEAAIALMGKYVAMINSQSEAPPRPAGAVALSAASTVARMVALAKAHQAIAELVRTSPPTEVIDGVAWLAEIGAYYVGQLLKLSGAKAPDEISAFGSYFGTKFVQSLYEGYRLTPEAIVEISRDMNPRAGNA